MSAVKGKSIALSGSIVSVFGSTLFLIIGIIFRIFTGSSHFKNMMIDGSLINNPNISHNEALHLAEESVYGFTILSTIIMIGSIFYLIIGIVGIILSRKLNHSNTAGIGAAFIIFAVIHFFVNRWVVFILFIIAGIQILSSKENKFHKEDVNYLSEQEEYLRNDQLNDQDEDHHNQHLNKQDEDEIKLDDELDI